MVRGRPEEGCGWTASFPFQSHIPALGMLSCFFSLAVSSAFATWLKFLLDFHLLHILCFVLMVNRACTVN